VFKGLTRVHTVVTHAASDDQALRRTIEAAVNGKYWKRAHQNAAHLLNGILTGAFKARVSWVGRAWQIRPYSSESRRGMRSRKTSDA
jgi:hypothetical protein